MSLLNTIYSDKIELSKIDKVLCILEGKSELNFIKKVYELNNSLISCDDFTDTKIKLSWGKAPIEWNNKEECNFQGGNITGCKVPEPVIESLNNENISMYKAILVIFDRDCDTNDLVSIESNELLETYNNFIFVSNPCFEKVGIDFIKTNEIEKYIIDNYSILDNSQCKWYKNNFNNLPKSTLPEEKKIFKRVQSLDKLIEYLSLEDIKDETVELKDCILFIKSNL